MGGEFFLAVMCLVLYEFFWFDDIARCTGPLQLSSYSIIPRNLVQHRIVPILIRTISRCFLNSSRQVRLFNDPLNKREYVARCLTELVGLSDGLAYQVMMQAHQFGLAAIIRCHQERAELYRDTLLEQGLVVDMVPVDDDE